MEVKTGRPELLTVSFQHCPSGDFIITPLPISLSVRSPPVTSNLEVGKFVPIPTRQSSVTFTQGSDGMPVPIIYPPPVPYASLVKTTSPCADPGIKSSF